MTDLQADQTVHRRSMQHHVLQTLEAIAYGIDRSHERVSSHEFLLWEIHSYIVGGIG